jgi:sigma-B regulation protein RsbU (phosphoserine phosphatase)
MSHLSALLRTLISIGLPLDQLMERASRVFCESTLPTHYATLVCGRAAPSGEIELCNAGHPPPLLISGGTVAPLPATSLPVGMFCNERFASETVRLGAGDVLLLYTDGLLEAENDAGADYGQDRLRALAQSPAPSTPRAIVDACVRDLGRFLVSRPPSDDVTIMALRRA